jgi:ankyrin repeat protein
MIVAASFAGVEAVDLLCEYGWSVTSPTDLGFTPLMAAAERGRADMVRHLSDADVDLDARDAHGLTALMYAAKGQHPETVEILLRAGASAEVKDNRGWSAARHARLRGVGTQLGRFEINARIPCLRRTKASRLLEEWSRR